MGLPIAKLVIATNSNDILARALANGRYEIRGVTATTSPSMDIEVSSNFERLLFEAYGREGARVDRKISLDLPQNGFFTIDQAPLEAIRADFAAGSADVLRTRELINETYRATGFLPDPHTAVGLAVASRFSDPAVPMVTLATAHPAKFPEAVKAATGCNPKLPDGFEDLLSKEEVFSEFDNDRISIERFILRNARAVAERV